MSFSLLPKQKNDPNGMAQIRSVYGKYMFNLTAHNTWLKFTKTFLVSFNETD